MRSAVGAARERGHTTMLDRQHSVNTIELNRLSAALFMLLSYRRQTRLLRSMLLPRQSGRQLLFRPACTVVSYVRACRTADRHC